MIQRFKPDLTLENFNICPVSVHEIIQSKTTCKGSIKPLCSNIGMRPLMPSTILLFIIILHINLNSNYRNLLNLPSPLHNELDTICTYIMDLKQDLWEKNIEELHRKEKDVNGFSNIVDFLINMFLPCAWLLSDFEDKCYSFSFIMPYTSFFELNSHFYILYICFLL